MSNKSIKELRNLSKDELATRIRETEKELFDLRMQFQTGQLENTSSIWFKRKNLARMKTLRTQAAAKQAESKGAAAAK